jgi:hypothetical protein
MRDHSGGGGPIINYPCMLFVEDQIFAMGHSAMDLDVLSNLTFVNQLNFPGLLSLGCDEHEQCFHTSQVFPTPNLMEVGTWK